MALQTSGPISLNDIHIEAGGTSGTSASLNDSDIRDMISKGSGATSSFSEYYGASSTATLKCSHIGSIPKLSLGDCNPGGYFGAGIATAIEGYRAFPESLSGSLAPYFEDVVIGLDLTYYAGHFLILVYKDGMSGAGAGLSNITLTRDDGGYTNSSPIQDNRGVYGNWNSDQTRRLALFSEIDTYPGVSSWYNSLVYNAPGSFGNTEPLTITLT
jgi:hypothetical protein